MRRSSSLASALVIGLVLAACASPSGDGDPGPSGDGVGPGGSVAAEPSQGNGGGGGGGTGDIPTISTRSYTGGSAQVSVSGAFTINEEVPINTGASYSDVSYTWLQYGNSGDVEPNALMTFGEGDIGVSAGMGTFNAIASYTDCTGETTVTDTSVSGHYACSGVVSYDSESGALGEVNMEITFTADS